MPFRSAWGSADINLMGLICFEDFLHLPINMLMYFAILFFLLMTIQKMPSCLITRETQQNTEKMISSAL